MDKIQFCVILYVQWKLGLSKYGELKEIFVFLNFHNFLLKNESVLSHFSCVWLLVIPWTVALQVLCPEEFSGKNTGVGCHDLLQGIIPTQRSSQHLLCLQHWQVDLFHLRSPTQEWHLLIKNDIAHIFISLIRSIPCKSRLWVDMITNLPLRRNWRDICPSSPWHI